MIYLSQRRTIPEILGTKQFCHLICVKIPPIRQLSLGLMLKYLHDNCVNDETAKRKD